MPGTSLTESPWPEIGAAATVAGGPYRRRRRTLAVLTLAAFMVGIDNTVLNVALPSLVRELGASVSQLQWITPPIRWCSPACC